MATCEEPKVQIFHFELNLTKGSISFIWSTNMTAVMSFYVLLNLRNIKSTFKKAHKFKSSKL